jgi:glycosyltransferase involved in cell wall biosynthesis
MAARDDSSAGRPRVSVIIPCHDDGQFLREAVGSVGALEPVEVIVVDDGSDDPGTLDVLDGVEADGIIVIRHTRNLGVSETRNSGLRAASAPFVLPLDADDLVAYPGALSEMADRLDAEPAAAACFGDYIEFGDHLLIRKVPHRIDPFRIAFTNEYPSSALFRRSVLEGLGGWKRVGSELDARADWNLWMTLAEHYATGVHLGSDRFTYLRRVHRGRLAEAARRHHRQIYRDMRRAHPRLFGDLRAHRRASDLRALHKLMFPLAYGARAWWPFEPRVHRWLDRLGILTMAHPLKEGQRERVAFFVDARRQEARDRQASDHGQPAPTSAG